MNAHHHRQHFCSDMTVYVGQQWGGKLLCLHHPHALRIARRSLPAAAVAVDQGLPCSMYVPVVWSMVLLPAWLHASVVQRHGCACQGTRAFPVHPIFLHHWPMHIAVYCNCCRSHCYNAAWHNSIMRFAFLGCPSSESQQPCNMGVHRLDDTLIAPVTLFVHAAPCMSCIVM